MTLVWLFLFWGLLVRLARVGANFADCPHRGRAYEEAWHALTFGMRALAELRPTSRSQRSFSRTQQLVKT